MSANVTTTPSSTIVSSRRSLLSKFTNPLKARARNLTDFYIRPAEPHRQYSPGDLVKGAVHLTVLKSIRITHLTVCLHGFVRVFKNPSSANEPFHPDASLNGSSTKRSHYFGNGHASLFQDEIILCGEGRIEPGIYEFNFELEFPEKGVPTSIDFERGTISYMITSTITRPTSIAGPASCDAKISLVETVDIGPLTAPKPRTISLEPVSRRKGKKMDKGKQVAPQDVAQETTRSGPVNEVSRTASSPRPDESVSQYGDVEHSNNPQSPVESDILSSTSAVTGTESTASSSTGLSFRLGPTPSAKTAKISNHVQSPDKTIRATIELLKLGCLPGDSFALKVSIWHIKAIKSMHGIIITLYRQGRIDSAPPRSLFGNLTDKEAEKFKHEEYYPKSKTGLGGLSLRSAGSSSVFRKDLAQTFAPILVDPVSLTSVVNVSVRVPEDTFPTISGVPGEMVSFKYHIEVVVDLGGKLAGQQRHVPLVGTMAQPSPIGASGSGRGDGSFNILTATSGSIVDTDHIRRERSVVGCLFEVVIGSTDSARKRGRGNVFRTQSHNRQPETPISPTLTNHSIHDDQSEQPHPYEYHSENHAVHSDQPSRSAYDTEPAYEEFQEEPLPALSDLHVPPPDLAAEAHLSEKERARLHAERLLPSEPPLETEPSSSSTITASNIPSAPPIDDNNNLYDAEDMPHSLPQHFNTPTAPTLAAPSAPTLEDLAPVPGAANDDKQELERQRMLAEASAPDFPVGEEDDGIGEGSGAIQYGLSAPVLDEGDEYASGGGGQHSHRGMPRRVPVHDDELPRYER
ncbi:arrestin domain-containing protein [Calycina marina]|uniref:Arrestin domain-containing protein n=1 Tax=Calycina marina TaxID=1763456 RepID=A0A9P7ZCD1_9HELO|nr:arrestin domain-containing protein [Calycina marina]